MSDIVLVAEELAKKYHDGQLDKQGKPYIGHVFRVAETVKPESPIVVAAALLHDVLEDTEATDKDLRQAGIPLVTIHIVSTLTRDKDKESYEDFIERIANCGDSRACKIKIADLIDNTDPARGEINKSLRLRYHAAMKRLIFGP